MSVLRFESVSKQYPGGHPALVDVSFQVEEGEMLFVTGHSGAGKSTLLKLIHLSERPSRGAVVFNDHNLLRVRGGKVALHRRQVGVVYQDHRLLTDRTIGENVALPLILRGTRRAEIGKRVRSVLERMGLAHREKALPTQLSAGEQQRVGIARAIVSEPRLLVADDSWVGNAFSRWPRPMRSSTERTRLPMSARRVPRRIRGSATFSPTLRSVSSRWSW